jgi:hypothetical protein
MSLIVGSTSNVGRKRSRLALKLVLIFLLLPAALFAAYTWVSLHFAYSSGERAGYVQKISSKGWICKTWEGELGMTTAPGVAPQIFPFTVRDDAVAHRIEQAAGQRVALSYEQHKGVPGSCFGETEYFITGVRPVGP